MFDIKKDILKDNPSLLTKYEKINRVDLMYAVENGCFTVANWIQRRFFAKKCRSILVSFQHFLETVLKGVLAIQAGDNPRIVELKLRSGGSPGKRETYYKYSKAAISKDSFLSKECYPFDEAHNSEYFFFEAPNYGGHVGFMSSFKPSENRWLEKRMHQFIEKEINLKF